MSEDVAVQEIEEVLRTPVLGDIVVLETTGAVFSINTEVDDSMEAPFASVTVAVQTSSSPTAVSDAEMVYESPLVSSVEPFIQT